MNILKVLNRSDVDAKSSFMKVVFGVVLMSVAAQVYVPIKPVAITFHTMIALLIGLSYTPREAFLTMLSYILLGCAGLPIFTAFSYGVGKIFGPAGGYYFGMLLSTTLLSMAINKFKITSFVGQLIACTFASIVVFTVGVPWLAFFTGFENAFFLGFVPFIIPGAIKALVLCAVLNSYRKFVKR